MKKKSEITFENRNDHLKFKKWNSHYCITPPSEPVPILHREVGGPVFVGDGTQADRVVQSRKFKIQRNQQ